MRLIRRSSRPATPEPPAPPRVVPFSLAEWTEYVFKETELYLHTGQSRAARCRELFARCAASMAEFGLEPELAEGIMAEAPAEGAPDAEVSDEWLADAEAFYAQTLFAGASESNTIPLRERALVRQVVAEYRAAVLAADAGDVAGDANADATEPNAESDSAPDAVPPLPTLHDWDALLARETAVLIATGVDPAVRCRDLQFLASRSLVEMGLEPEYAIWFSQDAPVPGQQIDPDRIGEAEQLVAGIFAVQAGGDEPDDVPVFLRAACREAVATARQIVREGMAAVATAGG